MKIVIAPEGLAARIAHANQIIEAFRFTYPIQIYAIRDELRLFIDRRSFGAPTLDIRAKVNYGNGFLDYRQSKLLPFGSAVNQAIAALVNWCLEDKMIWRLQLWEKLSSSNPNLFYPELLALVKQHVYAEVQA